MVNDDQLHLAFAAIRYTAIYRPNGCGWNQQETSLSGVSRRAVREHLPDPFLWLITLAFKGAAHSKGSKPPT
jgi:hypothetical protein